MENMTAAVDPKLKTAIRNGKAQDGSVHAAFTLRGVDGKALSPETTDKVVKAMVAKAAKTTKQAADKVVVFKNLQSFAVEAPAAFVETLTNDDAIGTAALGS